MDATNGHAMTLPPRPFEFEIKPSHNPNSLPPNQPPFTSSAPAVPHHHPLPGAVDAAGYPPSYDHHYLHHHPTPPIHLTAEQQNIHTLFVSGLPDDVKAREIHNLFRRRPGFESCQLKYTGRGDQVVAFATFFNHQSAIAAMSSLNGATFDPQSGAKLHIELARTNSRTKHPRDGGAYTIIDKRVKVTNDDQEASGDEGDGESDEPSGSDNDNSSNRGGPTSVQSDQKSANVDNAQATLNEQSDKSSAGGIPPCSTLFIANLGPNCTEEELKQALSKFSGFQTVKMRGRGGMPVAFADFTDADSSTTAMKNLQDTLLGSSDRGGLHLEYARSKMRKG